MEEKDLQTETEISAPEKAENAEEATLQLPKKITKEDFAPSTRKRDKFWVWMKYILYTMISSFCIAFAAHMLLGPNHFTIGGATGIAVLLYEAIGLSKSITLACINLPLIVLSFFFVKKKFAILSALNIGMQTLWMLLLEQLLKDATIVFPGGEPAKIFAAIASGLCVGLSISLAFKVGGSTGGADILSVMIQRKIKASSISMILFSINCIIIGSSIFVFKSENVTEGTLVGNMLMPIVLAAFEAFIEIRTYEAMLNGFQSAVEFRIITDKPEAMSNAIMRELSRGVTAIPATGMYTKITHTMLVCVVSKRQVVSLQKIMKTVDPDSFAVTSKATQVLGLGFFNQEI